MRWVGTTDLSRDVIEDTCCPMIRHNHDSKVANQRNCQQVQSNVHFEVAKEGPQSMRANLIPNIACLVNHKTTSLTKRKTRSRAKVR